LLISDLLAYSRTDLDERRFEETDLKSLMEEVRNELQEELQEHNASLEITGSVSANVIGFQFKQLLHNLVSNSLKFAHPERPLKIKVHSSIVDGTCLNPKSPGVDRDSIRVVVSDNGIGFDPEFNEKIFGLFQRLHDRSHYEGTGLGLAIVRKITDNHNGHISASGTPGEGVEFTIHLPG